MVENTSRLNYIQKIVDILVNIRNRINPETDVVWTSFTTPKQLIESINAYIKSLQEGDYEVLGNLSMMFAPTGIYQELSISNGWGEDFLQLSDQFDKCLERFRSI